MSRPTCVLAGLILTLAAAAGCQNQLSGTIEVDNTPFELESCRAGQAYGPVADPTFRARIRRESLNQRVGRVCSTSGRFPAMGAGIHRAIIAIGPRVRGDG